MNANRNDNTDRRLEPSRRTVIPSAPSSAIFPGWGVKF
jgi:hypothetical protein